MFSFIDTAYAMAPGGGGESGGGAALAQFFPLILIFAIFWFLVIRPQQKRTKAHRALVSELKKGDEVYTDSGIHGTILKVSDDTVTLEIAPKVSIKLLRARIADMSKQAKSSPAKTKGKDKEEDSDE